MSDELKPDTGRPSDRANHEPKVNLADAGLLPASRQADVPAALDLSMYITREEMGTSLSIYITREEMHDQFANLMESVNAKLQSQFNAVRDLLAGNERVVTAVLQEAQLILRGAVPVATQSEAPATSEPEATASTPPSPVGSGG